jgi:GntR family transcriptional regulator, transcriptional repressor for pyruvate dehydrogenase complex
VADFLTGGEPTNFPHRSEKISEVVARQIVREIARRKFVPGTMLPSEAVMLERFGVARASLREALRILETYGLITIRPGPGGGPVIQDLTSREFARSSTFYFNVAGMTFRELVEARTSLEPMMARLMAANATSAAREKLNENVRATRGALKDRTGEYFTLSGDFHKIVAASANNRILDLYVESLRELFFQRLAEGYPIPDRETNCSEHEAIADAIQNGKPQLAEERMAEHMSTFMKSVSRRYKAILDEIVGWL